MRFESLVCVGSGLWAFQPPRPPSLPPSWPVSLHIVYFYLPTFLLQRYPPWPGDCALHPSGEKGQRERETLIIASRFQIILLDTEVSPLLCFIAHLNAGPSVMACSKWSSLLTRWVRGLASMCCGRSPRKSRHLKAFSPLLVVGARVRRPLANWRGI